jgi:hypothetical protein
VKTFAALLITAALCSYGVADPPLKVLFVGNSQMFYYDLPTMIELMSESAPASNPRIEPGKALVGGATLKRHWENTTKGSAREQLSAGKWDYVVIQELYNSEREPFEEYAIKFDDEIKKAGSKTILFATANVTKYYSPKFSYPDSFKKLNDMQLDLGRKRGIPVAAAGYAWMRYLGSNPTEEQMLDLYDKDKGHPGAKGTYIYACLLYAVITGKTPEGLVSEFPNIKGGIVIPKDEALKMQKAAWEQYQENVNR